MGINLARQIILKIVTLLQIHLLLCYKCYLLSSMDASSWMICMLAVAIGDIRQLLLIKAFPIIVPPKTLKSILVSC